MFVDVLLKIFFVKNDTKKKTQVLKKQINYLLSYDSYVPLYL